MTLVCRQCSRVNPEEAYYCYFDGAALAGRASSDGPINLGAQPFPSPFVFPSGVNCRNFDQLAMACQQNWDEAASCLKEGFLGSFFGAIGRLDLARVAKEAAEFPDVDRGLDQLLGKLPSQTLEAPRLNVEPTEINLGQLKVGVDQKLDLHLENQGMRLVYGSITSEAPWLTLGGHSSRLFELKHEMTLPVQIQGTSLRARAKPQEGRLVVESNAGNFLLTVKIEVPPVPFPDGVLGGALSPRQIAEKAKANPGGAVPLFESGQVAKWFAANGLTYPVQGPTAPGTAGVQQFFEALGLAKPPKVEFTPQPIVLEGDPGQVFEIPLQVSTQDKKLVYAYATGDHPWIDGNTVKPAGRQCTIALKVTVPQEPGETLSAKVTVHANGNQRFSVPLTLTVRGEKGAFTFTPVADEPAGDDATFAMADDPPFAVAPAPMPRRDEPQTGFAPRPATMPAISSLPEGDGDIEFQPAKIAAPKRANSRQWLHAIPAALLVVTLGGLVVRDYLSADTVDDVDPRERVSVRLDWSAKPEKSISNSLMFGLEFVGEDGRKAPLTFSPLGQTNSVVLKIDGRERVLGKIQHGKLDGPPVFFKNRSRVATWVFSEDRISVTQTLQLIAGEPIEVSDGVFKRFYDTSLVRYKVTNIDTKPRSVGFRFLLDTYIGMNDVPLFALPGRAGLVRRIVDLQGKEIPDYIQALERPNLQDPGVVAQLNLRISDRLEFPSRVSLTQFPGAFEKNQFEIAAPDDAPPPNPTEPKPASKGGKTPKGAKPPPNIPNPAAVNRDSGRITDSVIALYWKTETMAPGASREFGFTYGVGNVGGLAELTILNPGPIVQGSDFSIVALVANAQKGTEATIDLPAGLELVGDSKSTLSLSPEVDSEGKVQPSPATWIIRAPIAGQYKISVTSGGVTTHRVVTVRRTSIF